VISAAYQPMLRDLYLDNGPHSPHQELLVLQNHRIAVSGNA